MRKPCACVYVFKIWTATPHFLEKSRPGRSLRCLVGVLVEPPDESPPKPSHQVFAALRVPRMPAAGEWASLAFGDVIALEISLEALSEICAWCIFRAVER